MEIRVDATAVVEQLNRARREANAELRSAIATAASEQFLPRVRSLAPRVVEPFLAVKATSRSAYITTRGPRVGDRITGLLNFGASGGNTKTTIPTEASALATPWGPRASVSRARHQVGKHFIERGIQEEIPRAEETILNRLLGMFGKG